MTFFGVWRIFLLPMVYLSLRKIRTLSFIQMPSFKVGVSSTESVQGVLVPDPIDFPI